MHGFWLLQAADDSWWDQLPSAPTPAHSRQPSTVSFGHSRHLSVTSSAAASISQQAVPPTSPLLFEQGSGKDAAVPASDQTLPTLVLTGQSTLLADSGEDDDNVCVVCLEAPREAGFLHGDTCVPPSTISDQTIFNPTPPRSVTQLDPPLQCDDCHLLFSPLSARCRGNLVTGL